MLAHVSHSIEFDDLPVCAVDYLTADGALDTASEPEWATGWLLITDLHTTAPIPATVQAVRRYGRGAHVA